TGRITALAALGKTDAARMALKLQLGSATASNARLDLAPTAVARLQLALGELGAAKVTLERARRIHPRDPEVTSHLAGVHARAAQTHRLPLASRIVQASRAIPGWFNADEAELLIALTVQTATRCGSGTPPMFVEIGSYCGRGTVVIGLTLRGVGRTDARIVAIDEPSLGPAPDGRPAREVLRASLAEHGLSG